MIHDLSNWEQNSRIRIVSFFLSFFFFLSWICWNRKERKTCVLYTNENEGGGCAVWAFLYLIFLFLFEMNYDKHSSTLNIMLYTIYFSSLYIFISFFPIVLVISAVLPTSTVCHAMPCQVLFITFTLPHSFVININHTRKRE